MRKYKRKVDERTEVFLVVVGHLEAYSDQGLKDIAYEADVHWTTLYNWKSYKVTHPRIDTLVRVARALGYDVQLTTTKKPKLRLIHG